VAGVSAETAPAEREARRALATLCAVLFLTFLDTTIVSVALADVQTTLHAGVSQLQWVVNGYAVAFASFMLAAGTLGDRFGRRRVLLVGLGAFCAGSLVAAVAPNPDTLIAGRVLMGLGAAASEPGTLSIIRHLYPDGDRRARALGTWVAVSGLALAAGPVVGGALVGLGGWRDVFYLNLAAGVVLFAAAHRLVPESADPTTVHLDVIGSGLIFVAIAALTFAVMVGEQSGFASRTVVVLFAAGVIGLLAFLRNERRAPAPILDIGYLASPAFSGALVVAFAIFFGIFSIFFFSALYLQVVVGYSGYRTAVEFVPMAATMIAAALVSGRLVSLVGARLPMAGGAALAGVGILLSDAALTAHGTPPGWLVGSLAASGLGFGLAVVPVTTVALSVVPARHSGMAASATNTSRELGAVFGVAVLGALVNGHLTSDLTARLHALGIPSAFQAIVISAVETGGLPGSSGVSQAERAYGPIVAKVIHAAYGAFRAGLDISLLVSGATILAAAVVALATMGRPALGSLDRPVEPGGEPVRTTAAPPGRRASAT